MAKAQERRKHVLYLTRNTEYHCRAQECVGVRDRNTKKWNRWHPALRSKLMGILHADSKVYRRPMPGFKLVFAGKQTVMTSSLQSINRPPKRTLFHYTSLCCSGECA